MLHCYMTHKHINMRCKNEENYIISDDITSETLHCSDTKKQIFVPIRVKNTVLYIGKKDIMIYMI